MYPREKFSFVETIVIFIILEHVYESNVLEKITLCIPLKCHSLWKVNNICTILNIQFQVCFIFTAKVNAYANKKSTRQNLQDNPHTITFFLVTFLLCDINFYSKKDSIIGSFLKIFSPRQSFCSFERPYKAIFLLLNFLGKLKIGEISLTSSS